VGARDGRLGVLVLVLEDSGGVQTPGKTLFERKITKILGIEWAQMPLLPITARLPTVNSLLRFAARFSVGYIAAGFQGVTRFPEIGERISNERAIRA